MTTKAVSAANRQAGLAEPSTAGKVPRQRSSRSDRGPLLDTVVDSIDQGLILESKDGRIEFANLAAQRIFGVRPADMQCQRDSGHWRAIHEDGSPWSKATHPPAVAVRTGLPQRRRLMGIHRDDEPLLWLLITAVPVLDPANGEVTGSVTTLSDVTAERATAAELQRSQQRLAAAQEITGLAWWEYDLATDRHHWSDQMFRLVGLEPGGVPPDLEGYLALMHPADRPTAEAFLAGCCADRTHAAFRVVRPDGTVRTLRSWSQPQLDTDGTPQRVFGTTLDVTQEYAAAQDLADSQERLRSAHALTGLAWWELALDTGELQWSAEMYRLVELSAGRDTMTIERWRSMVDPDDLADADAMDTTAAQHGSGYRNIFRVHLGDGSTRYLQAWATAVAGPDGTSRALRGATLDVTQREVAQKSLADREEVFRVAFDNAPIGMTMLDVAAGSRGRLLRVNDAFCHLLGYRREELLRLGMADLTHPDDVETDLARARKLFAGEVSSVCYEKRYRHHDGHTVHALVSTALATDAEGGPLYLIAHTVDVTEREAAARTLATSERQFRVAFDNAPIGLIMLSLQPGRVGEVLRANQAFAAMLGYSCDEVLALDISQWTDSANLADNLIDLDRVARGEVSTLAFEKQFLHRDGRRVPTLVNVGVVTDAAGDPQYLLSQCRDMTEQHRQQRELERLALTDSLTGLANRTRLEDRVRLAIADLAREPGHVALLLLDLDRFKLVNDSLGHPAGDALLTEIGRRLVAHTRRGQLVARLGGDEFVVLLDRVSDLERAEDVARRMLDVLRKPFVLPSGESLVTTSSLGIATASTPDHGVADLFREADLALYRAKDTGRDRLARFDAGLRSRVVSRLDTEHRIRRALAEGHLRLHLQPVVDLATRRRVGYEALVRVDDAERGMIPPTEFIEVAEDSGLIVDIDTWVVERVVSMLPALQARQGAAARVAVNASARTLQQPSFVARVGDALRASGGIGGNLLVELTESILLDESPALAASLAGLSSLGAQIGIDDFGTGFSALAYLARFDLDFLKIDQSFVSPLGTSSRSDAVVSAIIQLAHAHDLTVTAEGVETAQQAAALVAMGCDHGQGWLFGRPGPAQEQWGG